MQTPSQVMEPREDCLTSSRPVKQGATLVKGQESKLDEQDATRGAQQVGLLSQQPFCTAGP